MDRAVKIIMFLFLIGVFSCQPLTLTRADNPISTTDVTCKAEILSPSTNTSYADLMPLNFTVEWAKGNWTQWVDPQYFYSIDNGSRVSVITEPYPYIYFEDTDPTIVSINDTIDVSNLTDGMHTLTLYADGTVNDANLILSSAHFNLSTTHFLIGSIPPSPKLSPSSTSNTIFGLVILLSSAILLSVLLFRRHRKKLRAV